MKGNPVIVYVNPAVKKHNLSEIRCSFMEQGRSRLCESFFSFVLMDSKWHYVAAVFLTISGCSKNAKKL